MMNKPTRPNIRARPVWLAGAALMAGSVLTVVGCGGDDQGRGVATGGSAGAETHAVVPATPYGLYWAGRSFERLPLTSVGHDDGVTTFIYGTCEVRGDEGGCMPALEIQVESLCTRNALMLDVRPRGRYTTRGITVLEYGEGDLAVATGDSNVLVAGQPDRARRAVAALRPVRGGQALAALPQPRYPLYYVAQLRSVSHIYARTRNLRAVRAQHINHGPGLYPMGVSGIVCVMAETQRGYGATKDQLLTRLRRIEGQIRGLQGMVDEDRYCIDILTQISAAQAALDKVALGLLDEHAHHCVIGADTAQERDAKTDELMAAVGRLMRRG